MKLIHPPIVATDPSQGRRRPDAQPAKPVAPVDAVERTRAPGSYTSHSQQTRLPGKFIEQNHQAIHSYLHTASLDADGGELIGIDTYA